MHSRFLSGFFVLMLAVFPGHAQSRNMLHFPYIQKKVCPFECCQFGKWISKSPLKVYANEGDATRVSFTIAPGDSFIAVTGNVHMMRPGIVVVTKPVAPFSPGDTLYTLAYRGEGFIDVWHRGKLENIEMFWGPMSESSSPAIKSPRGSRYSGVLVSKPHMIWWVQITCRDGRSGWLKLVNTSDSGFSLEESIDGMDGCD